MIFPKNVFQKIFSQLGLYKMSTKSDFETLPANEEEANNHDVLDRSLDFHIKKALANIDKNEQLRILDKLIKMGFKNGIDITLCNNEIWNVIYNEIPVFHASKLRNYFNMNSTNTSWANISNNNDNMKINIALWIETINDINELNQTTEIDFFVRYNWIQKHLIKSFFKNGDILPETSIKHHKTYIDNNQSLKIIGNKKLILEDKKIGLVREVIRYKGKCE